MSIRGFILHEKGVFVEVGSGGGVAECGLRSKFADGESA